MSEERNGQQQLTMYLMGAVVVLLIAVIGVLVWQSRSTTPPVAQVPAQADPATSGQQPPAGMGGVAPTGEFDPAKATKVPAGMKPEAYVKAYFEAVVKGDYKKAYDMLPADKKAAQDAESFGNQLKGYGMNGYKMGASKTQGDDTSVEATAKTPNGDFGYTWTFTKVKGELVVKSRTLTGMGGGGGGAAPQGMPGGVPQGMPGGVPGQ